MTTTTIIGATTNTLAEVDTARRSLRTSLVPMDYGSGGSFRKAMTSGTFTAGLTAASLVYAFRWAPTPSTAVCLVRRVRISAGATTSFGAAAGFTAFNMFAARAYTTIETSGGTAGTFTGNNGKLRTSMATSLGVTNYISTTAAISGGTATLDTNPLATLSSSIIAGAGAQLITNAFDLFDVRPGEQPLVLVNNEGFVIKATVPGTGTWQLGVDVVWDEVLSY